jgi:DNA polymerase-3 subunit beta
MKSLVITGEDFKIFSRIVALQFPKYERVLPTGTLSQVDFFTNRLSSSARRVLLASDKKANVVKFSFHDSGLTLSARNEVSSESKETVVLEGKDFSNSEFAINGIYLSEICSVVESEKLEFRYRSYKDPVLVTPKTEPLGCKSLHLVIPIDQSASREAGT